MKRAIYLKNQKFIYSHTIEKPIINRFHNLLLASKSFPMEIDSPVSAFHVESIVQKGNILTAWFKVPFQTDIKSTQVEFSMSNDTLKEFSKRGQIIVDYIKNLC